MKNELIPHNKIQEVIRVNLKMNVLCGMINSSDVLYGYSLGASLCATNGREDRYQESFDLATAFTHWLPVLFKTMEDHPEEEVVTIKTESECFSIDITAYCGLNDLDIFCTRYYKEEISQYYDS